jgi:thioredoxin 1
MTIDAPIHVNEANLPRVLSASAPAVLVFWKRECGPCNQLTPVLDRVAKQYAGKALVVRINVEDEPGLARRYSVAQLPALVFTKVGQEVARGVGAATEGEVASWVEYLVNGGSRPPLFAGPSTPYGASNKTSSEGTGWPASGAATRAANAGTARQAAGTAQAAHPLVLTDALFPQVIRESTVPVLVDFWAEWCGPCKMIAPHVAALAQEFAGRAVVGKMNVDENPRTAGQFGIMSIPTLLIFMNGRVVDQIVGAQPGNVIRQRLARHVS